MSFRARLTLAVRCGGGRRRRRRLGDHLRARPQRAAQPGRRDAPGARPRRSAPEFDIIGDPTRRAVPQDPARTVRRRRSVRRSSLRRDGEAITPAEAAGELPASERAKQAARGEIDAAFFEDAHVQGTHVRVLTLPLGQGYAVQVARSLEEADSALDRISRYLITLALDRNRTRGRSRTARRRERCSHPCSGSHELPRRSPRRGISRAGSTWAARTSCRASPPASTRCSARWRTPRGRSANSSPMPRTSCGRR